MFVEVIDACREKERFSRQQLVDGAMGVRFCVYRFVFFCTDVLNSLMLFVDIGFGLFFVRIVIVASLFKQKRAFF